MSSAVVAVAVASLTFRELRKANELERLEADAASSGAAKTFCMLEALFNESLSTSMISPAKRGSVSSMDSSLLCERLTKSTPMALGALFLWEWEWEVEWLVVWEGYAGC